MPPTQSSGGVKKWKQINHLYVCAGVRLLSVIASLVETVALILCSTLHTPPDPSPSVLPHSCVMLVVNELWQGLWGLVKTHTHTQDETVASGFWTHTATLANCLTVPSAPVCPLGKTREEESSSSGVDFGPKHVHIFLRLSELCAVQAMLQCTVDTLALFLA